jgi:hypothetical protein
MAIEIELDEMKRRVKTDADALNMALSMVAKKTEGSTATVAQLLAEDNEIRKAYGLNIIDAYPVQCLSYSPATGISQYARILGVNIVRESFKLPYATLVLEECESYDPSKRMTEISEKVDQRIKTDFPGMNFTKEEKEPIERMIRLSEIKKMQIAGGSDANTKVSVKEVVAEVVATEEAEVVEEEKKPSKKAK